MITGYDAFRWSLIALVYPEARPPEPGAWVVHMPPAGLGGLHRKLLEDADREIARTLLGRSVVK
jgi:hypothetical protein